MQKTLISIMLPIMLASCASPQMNSQGSVSSEQLVSKSTLPRVILPYQEIEEVLACIKTSGAIRNKTFVVGPFADSTGKVNAVAIGSTGNYLPQGGSSTYITDAIKKAGGRVISTYFGQPSKRVSAHFAINGIFNSLDFGTPIQGDVRVGGIGPTFAKGWAQLGLTIQMDQAGTNLNKQISMVQRPVRYSQVGVGSSKSFWGTLVSGNVVYQNQERLQFEALNGPIALGVADVLLKEFKSAADHCDDHASILLKG